MTDEKILKEQGAQPQGNDLAMIVVTNITEHEDGSATYTFDMDEKSEKKITELGLEFILTCAAYRLDIQDALKVISDYGKTKECNDEEQTND